MPLIIVHVVEDHTVLYAAGGALLGVALGGFLAWLQQESKIGADRPSSMSNWPRRRLGWMLRGVSDCLASLR
jgi:hypothetical protein